MAEYFPLLERAVAGLADASPGARRAIYERARSALLGQLRNMDPPIPEEDVARESVALDDAIGRLEATFRAPETAASDAPPEPAIVLPPPAASGAPASVSRSSKLGPLPAPRTPIAPRVPGLPVAQSPAVAPQPPRERPVLAPRPTLQQRPSAPVQPQAGTPSDAPEKPPAPPASSPRPPRPARPLNTAPRIGIEPRLIGTGRDAPPLLAGPTIAKDQDAGSAPTMAPTIDAPAIEGIAVPISRIPTRTPEPDAAADANRTGASTPRARRLKGVALYAVIVVGALLVAGVAVEAWKLRDRPEQLTAAQQTSGDGQGDKASGRIDTQDGGKTSSADESGGTAVPPPVSVGSSSSAATIAEPAQTASPPEATLPATSSATPSNAPSATAPAQTTAPAPTVIEPPRTATVGVTQRAALLVDAPEDPQKVKTYPGTVVWKHDSVSNGQGQPLSDAIVADVDIPDAKLKMSMVMKKNLEPQFPASHTIEFHFMDLADNTIGAIKQINVPEMRLDDSSPTGDPMAGLPVAITDNYFLVGLSRGPAELSNMQMLETRNWIDVALLLSSGKAAKITFEKGTPGQRVVDEVVKSWQ